MTVIFFRDEGWYPLELPDDDNIAAHVKCNPGTLRVEHIDGRVLWPAPPQPAEGESE